MIIDAVSTWDDTSESVDYSVEDDNQLQPEDTPDRPGRRRYPDEGISPPERPYAKTVLDHPGRETLDELLAEEEPDPVSRLNNVLDELEQQRSDDAEREAEFPSATRSARPVRAVGRPGRRLRPDHESEMLDQRCRHRRRRRRRPRRPPCTSSRTTRSQSLGTQLPWKPAGTRCGSLTVATSASVCASMIASSLRSVVAS